MKLYEHYPNEDGTRRWRGRHEGYRVFLSEHYNSDVGYVDKYSFHVVKTTVLTDHNSTFSGQFYKTIEDCKNAAVAFITKDRSRIHKEVRQYKKELKNNERARED